MIKPVFGALLLTLFLVYTTHAQTVTQGDTLSRKLFQFETKITEADSSQAREDIFFEDSLYTKIKGITTFRGGPSRNKASIGRIAGRPKSLSIAWSYATGYDKEWGGGAGWTGQPCVVQWPDSIRPLMNISDALKADSAFTEVIQASLDGKIYFLNLETGKASRPAIDIHNPIKGSPAVDPRGYPLLYCGQGISNNGEFGFRIFSLIDQKKLFFLNGRDPFALRGWSAFDGSPLIHAQQDKMIVGGENGVFYSVDLNTTWKRDSAVVKINPKVNRYRYQRSKGILQGIENSVAAWHNKVFFADNNGYLQSVDINTLTPDWIHFNHDDSDATIVLDTNDSIPYLYTGSEVDIQEKNGHSFVKKINALTGQTVWVKKFPCYTIRGAHPVNGGMLSTPVFGKEKGKNLLVCSLSRYGAMYKGLLIAFDKKTGDIAWQTPLDNYAWSSPLDIYDKEGNMFIFLGDSKGYALLFDGATGQLLVKEKITELFEASPVAIDNKIIIASRPRQIFCLKID